MLPHASPYASGPPAAQRPTLDSIPYKVWHKLPHQKRMDFVALMTSPDIYEKVADVLEERVNVAWQG